MHAVGVRSTVTPEDIRQHPWIAGRWFYTLPGPLWDLLEASLRPLRINTEAMTFERQVTRIVEAGAGCVGLRDGTPFGDPYLVAGPPSSASDPVLAFYLRDCRQAGFATTDVDRTIAVGVTPFRDAEKAYLGWLLTNRTYLDELQQLHTAHPDLFADGQLAPQPIPFQSISGHAETALLQASDDPTARAVRAFCTRWRLRNMTGPVTFAPLSVQTPVGLPSMATELSQSSGTLVFIPDIAPLPDRDQLRILLENSTRQTIRHTEHLEEWYRWVRAGNLGRKSLANYAAVYVLQHYLRVLYSRYGDRLHRQHSVVARCVGVHQSLSADQVRRLMRLIKSRLGANWLQSEELSCRP